MIMDVASDHQTMWWITLGLGVVVLSAVILLLGFLTILVKDIDAGINAVSEEAGEVATQTATTSMLNDTITLARTIRDETGRHATCCPKP